MCVSLQVAFVYIYAFVCICNYMDILVQEHEDITFVAQRVACLLRKVVQEIERRISTQAEHLRTVNTIPNLLLSILSSQFLSTDLM